MRFVRFIMGIRCALSRVAHHEQVINHRQRPKTAKCSGWGLINHVFMDTLWGFNHGGLSQLYINICWNIIHRVTGILAVVTNIPIFFIFRLPIGHFQHVTVAGSCRRIRDHFNFRDVHLSRYRAGFTHQRILIPQVNMCMFIPPCTRANWLVCCWSLQHWRLMQVHVITMILNMYLIVGFTLG